MPRLPVIRWLAGGALLVLAALALPSPVGAQDDTTTTSPPTAPTTTVDVAVGDRITQDTPDLTLVVWLFVLAVLATAGMLAAGYVRTRR